MDGNPWNISRRGHDGMGGCMGYCEADTMNMGCKYECCG